MSEHETKKHASHPEGATTDAANESLTKEGNIDVTEHDTNVDDSELGMDTLLPRISDHFSLPKESCLVRSRKKANGVRVYHPSFSHQVVIEEAYDSSKGLEIQVKKMNDVTTGHKMLNLFYAIVAGLFAGFLLVFCMQFQLYLVMELSIESGATSGNPSLNIGRLLGVIFALIMFSHFFAEALVIAGQFIIDCYSDHTLVKTFVLRTKKTGHLWTEWVFGACFLLVPIMVGIVSLSMGRDDWWYITSLTWFCLVMGFFGIFCFSVIYYEVGSAYNIIKNQCNGDLDSTIAILMQCVLLRQKFRYSGNIMSSGLAQHIFSNSEATESLDDSNVFEESKSVSTAMWTRITMCMPQACFIDLSHATKKIYTVTDAQEYRPFLTRHNWSLERIMCSPAKSRYIAIVHGAGALTKGQLKSTIICSILYIIVTAVLVAVLLVWFDAPTEVIAIFLIIVLLVFYPSLKNTYMLIQLGRDLISVKAEAKSRKKRMTAAQVGNGACSTEKSSKEDPEEGNGKMRFRQNSFAWQSERQMEESEAVYHVFNIERVREATETLCWVTFVAEIGIFFIWPTIALFAIDFNFGIFFCFTSMISILRYYVNVVTAIQETGNMDLVGGETEQELWENKARLNDIVVNISANRSYRWWKSILNLLGLLFVALALWAYGDDGLELSNEALRYLPAQDFFYPGQSKDMRYPTCAMSNLDGAWGDESTMLDYAWLAGSAYASQDKIQQELDTWFSDGAGVEDLQDLVDEFRAREDPDDEFAVTFRLISVPSQVSNETTAIIVIRGTVNQWDMLADVQLWSAATWMEWLQFLIPIGELWTPILGELVRWMNTMASASLDRVAYYKLTSKFAEELGENDSFDRVQVTGHSLGGGLSLITGAQAKIPAVGLSAPNALISGKAFHPPLSEKDVNKYGFNIIPHYDVVPKLDYVSDQNQRIRCTSDVNMAFVTCHNPFRSLCEIMYTCGSDNRPIPCECVESFGYPEPIASEGAKYTFVEFCSSEKNQEAGKI